MPVKCCYHSVCMTSYVLQGSAFNSTEQEGSENRAIVDKKCKEVHKRVCSFN